MKTRLKTVTSDEWRVTRWILVLLLLLITHHSSLITALAQGNVNVTNPVSRPANVNIVSGTVTATTSAAGAAHEANSQVTASTTAGTLIIARPTRRSCLLKNTDASITIYYGAATVTSGNGMPLKAGESVVVTVQTLIQVIAASGSPVVAVFDEYD